MPALGDSDAEELQELKHERMALTKLVASISERDTLQFLTDEGLLPNYAFPEQGVLLHSVIIRDDKRVGPEPEDRVLTLEYERPGASAITELAPNNAFYAEGRKITIEQVDISRDKPVPWRFCLTVARTRNRIPSRWRPIARAARTACGPMPGACRPCSASARCTRERSTATAALAMTPTTGSGTST